MLSNARLQRTEKSQCPTTTSKHQLLTVLRRQTTAKAARNSPNCLSVTLRGNLTPSRSMPNAVAGPQLTSDLRNRSPARSKPYLSCYNFSP
eukprot:1450238-Lingulodinium_polyedra.AAC.1